MSKERCFFITKIVCLLLVLFIGYANGLVLSYDTYIVDQEELDSFDFSSYDSALIFGAGMEDEFTMSLLQEDRVRRGVMLYTDGAVKHLYMTGDDGTNRVNEVDYMKGYAVSSGVSEDVVYIDPQGHNSFLSCNNALNQLDLDRVVVVSQSWHLPRILYYCHSLGVDAIGVTSDLREYPGISKIWGHGLREVLARVKAVISIEWSIPLARTVY